MDSMVLMHYDNGNESAIDWWVKHVEDGWCFYVSVVSLMERFKGIANIPGPRDERLREFEVRIQTMKRERKIAKILSITKRIGKLAHDLIVEYCKRQTPPSRRSRMEALICDMLIAATALEKGILYLYEMLIAATALEKGILYLYEAF